MATNAAVERNRRWRRRGAVRARRRCGFGAPSAAHRLARRRRPACRSRPRRRHPSLCPLYGRHPGLIELALAGLPRRPGARLAAGSRRRLRARAALPRPPDRLGRPAALDPRRRRDRSRLARPAPRASKPLPTPNGAAARSAPRPRWSTTGAASAPCSTAPRSASGSNARPDPARRGIRSPGSSRRHRRPGQRAGPWASAPSNCCSSTAACSTCSRPAPQPAATTD